MTAPWSLLCFKGGILAPIPLPCGYPNICPADAVAMVSRKSSLFVD